MRKLIILPRTVTKATKCTDAPSIYKIYVSTDTVLHRIRIYTEERAKIVAAVWGTELIQFLAALQI